jgi:oligopeptidase B
MWVKGFNALPAAGSAAVCVVLISTVAALACDRTSADTSTPEPDKTVTTDSLVPPTAEKRPHDVVSPHGTRVDEYYWLRDDTREDADVVAYLNAENEYKEAMLAPVASLRDELFNEIVGRIKQDDSSVPYHDRGYYYYSRFEEGAEYVILARKKGSLKADEEVLLDENELAKGHDFYSLGGTDVSPNNMLLAYGEDAVGRRQYTIRFKDLSNGKTLPDTIPNTTSSMVWAADDKTLFYVEKDPVTLLGVRVKKHVLGTDAAQDELVYEEKDHSYYMGVDRTGDHEYLTIELSSTISDEVRFMPADKPDAEFRVLAARERDFEYDADHIGKRWIIRTNWKAKNFRMMEARDQKGGDRNSWKEIIPHSDAVYIGSYDVFDDYLVLGERSDGLQRIRIREWKSGKERFVDSDEPAYAAWISVNAEQDSEVLRYAYTSLTTPNTVFDLNMRTGEKKLLKEQPVLGGFDKTNYETDRTWATARDGTKVPVSVVYRKGVQRDGTAPLYVYGYGSYGSSMDPSFRSHAVSLLDRGFVYAIAHIRGGQEMGRQWYEDGKLLKKKNTFTDFVDATEHLVEQKYGAPDKVVASGGSAGGLLVGAVVNLRPDLYRVIVAAVPFMDVVTTMLDESIPLTTNEFDEWGNPKEKKYYDYMLSYSPYDNIEAKDYPAILVTTGLWDSQVQYFEPAKWVARLRDRKTDQNPLLLHTNMEAGHGGASGRFRRHKERALEYAFVLQQLGMTATD